MRIDFHTHSFPARIAGKTAESLSHMAHSIYYICPDPEHLCASMAAAGVDYSVNLPVVTREDQTVSVNDKMIASLEVSHASGIINFGGMHPDFGDYRVELKRLKSHGIKGIKIHPPYQGMDLNDIRFKRLIGAASEEDLVVLTHAGLDIGIPDHNYASVEMILEILQDVRPPKFVLGHFGNWQDWEHVESDLAGAPVYFDTAFSFGPITPVQGEESRLIRKENLTAEDFVRIARKHGTDKILFATDSPWARQDEYVKFVERSTATVSEKNQIFSENAQALLGL